MWYWKTIRIKIEAHGLARAIAVEDGITLGRAVLDALRAYSEIRQQMWIARSLVIVRAGSKQAKKPRLHAGVV